MILQVPSSMVFETASLTGLELDKWAMTSGQQAPDIDLSLPPLHHQGYKYVLPGLSLLPKFWGSNSGLCKANHLPSPINILHVTLMASF